MFIMEKDNITIIVEQLTEWLRDKVNEEGMSQLRLSKQAHCTHSRINDFINPKKQGSIKGAALDLILRLFPELQRPILDALASRGGTAIHQEANGNTNSRITQTAGVGDASYRQRVQDLAVRLSGEDGTLQLASFLKALQGLE